MQYIKPHDKDDPTLGPDGCMYEYINGSWKKIFEFDGWSTYVQTQYDNYMNNTINLDELLDSLTWCDNYKKVSGYDGKFQHQYFGSCQYHSIYKMYLTLHILSYYNHNIKSIIGAEPMEFVPKNNYEEPFINKIKINELGYLTENNETTDIGFYKGNIIMEPWKFKFPKKIKDDTMEKYIWLPFFKKDTTLPEHLEILDKHIEKSKQDFREKMSIFTLESVELDNISTRLFKDVDVKYKLEDKSTVENPCNHDKIMWDHDDLLIGDGMDIIHIRPSALPEDYYVAYLKSQYLKLLKKLNELASLKTFVDAIVYSLERTDMWCGIPRIFEAIYDKKLECQSATTIKGGGLLNDWSDNYLIGAQIYVIIRQGIVPYVNDFYCPNT